MYDNLSGVNCFGKSSLNRYATKSELDYVKVSLESEIKTLSTDSITKAAKEALDQVVSDTQDSIDELDKRLDSAEGKLDKKADKDELAALSKSTEDKVDKILHGYDPEDSDDYDFLAVYNLGKMG